MRKILSLLATLAFMPVLSLAVEWKAQWIGAPWDGEEFIAGSINAAPEFRKEYYAGKRIESATAYVTGLGFFEFRVNGKKVGDEVLSPNETSYGHRPWLRDAYLSMDDSNWRDFRVMYLTYDITRLMHRGRNEFSALVGNGFYAIDSERWVMPYGSPRFICQIEVTYADGTTDTIVTGTDWQCASSPIVKNDLFLGEIYDARLESRMEWQNAVLRKAPDGKLVPQDGPADRVMETIKPKRITRLEDGRWEVDFGDYVSGWVRLDGINAPEGTEIDIEFPIECKGNGEYKYICKGTGNESYTPRFSWWNFTKAIVCGWRGELKPSNITALVIYSDVREYSDFQCSNELLNTIHRIWKRTQKDNMHLGVATDCPHREKGPYTGDGEVACTAVMHNFDARTLYRKWLRDISDCQDLETGYVPNGAPWHPGCGGGVPWGAAMNIIPWEYYLRYGDLGVLEENYIPMKEQLRHMLGWRLPDGTMLQQIKDKSGAPEFFFNLGEWCPPYSLPPNRLVHTWYLWKCADITARAARALGEDADYQELNSLADDIATCFHKAFYHPEEGSYYDSEDLNRQSGYGIGNGGGCGDGSNIFALAMGVPPEFRELVLETVKKEIKANNGHFNTGIYGTPLFFDVLCSNGMAQEAFEAMTKTDYPSFGWWIKQGAQTTWEQWNGEASRNHPMFGGSIVWMYRWLCGVQTDEAEPGYRHIIFRPTPAGDLEWAKYMTEAEGGKVLSHWKIRPDGKFILRLRVPRGSHATVYLPDGSEPSEVGPGHHRFCCRIP